MSPLADVKCADLINIQKLVWNEGKKSVLSPLASKDVKCADLINIRKLVWNEGFKIIHVL